MRNLRLYDLLTIHHNLEYALLTTYNFIQPMNLAFPDLGNMKGRFFPGWVYPIVKKNK